MNSILFTKLEISFWFLYEEKLQVMLNMKIKNTNQDINDREMITVSDTSVFLGTLMYQCLKGTKIHVWIPKRNYICVLDSRNSYTIVKVSLKIWWQLKEQYCCMFLINLKNELTVKWTNEHWNVNGEDPSHNSSTLGWDKPGLELSICYCS